MTDNEITREKTFSEELPYFKERIKEVFDNYDNPNGYEDPLYIAVLRDSNRVVRKAEEEINRQQEEIDRLTYNLWGVMHSVDKWLDGTELEQDEVNRSVTMREKTLRIVEEKQAEIERLKTDNALLRQDSNADSAEIRGLRRKLEISKSEAVKEFAERLKEKSFKTIRNYGLTKDVVEVCDIDNLVKEMVGENNA